MGDSFEEAHCRLENFIREVLHKKRVKEFCSQKEYDK